MDDLRAAVEAVMENHLPGIQLEWLQSRLSLTAELETEVADLHDLSAELQETINELREEKMEVAKRFSEIDERERNATSREAENEARFQGLNTREIDLELREAVIYLKEMHAADKVEMMRGVVGDVFSNNRFKYTVRDQVPVEDMGMVDRSDYNNPVAYSGGATLQQKTTNVEGEG